MASSAGGGAPGVAVDIGRLYVSGRDQAEVLTADIVASCSPHGSGRHPCCDLARLVLKSIAALVAAKLARYSLYDEFM